MKTNDIKKILAAVLTLLLGLEAGAQGVGIGDKDFTPNAAAMLDVQSKNKGVLVPRMTYTERMYIQANAQSVGLLVYQTDKEAGFYYWDGLAWKYLSPPQSTALPNFAAVATSGDYNDLVNRPTVSNGSITPDYNDLANKPTFAAVATSGDYNDLMNKPAISNGNAVSDYNSLTNKPIIPTRLQDLAQDENYYTTVSRAEREYWNGKANISNIPTRLQDLAQDENYYTTVSRAEREKWNSAAESASFSGNYNDLSNKPALKPVATSGSYNDLTDKPSFSVNLGGEDGEEVSLATVALTGSYNDLKDKPTIPGGNDVTWATVATTGSYSDLKDKPAIPTRLQDLEQNEIYYTTVSRAEREYWNGKADISNIPTRLQDLQQDENYYTTVSKAEREKWNAAAETGGFSGDYNDLLNKPRLGDLQQDEMYYTTVSKAERDAWNAKSNFSGSYGDLADKPTIPAHLKDLQTDEYYQTVSRGEKETWSSKVSQADLNEFITPTERSNWNNAAANATTAVTKTKLSDFDSNDDSKHYTVEEKTKLAGVATGAEVNVNPDWSAGSGDAQILNKPTLGDLAAKSKVSNTDIESDAAIALSKISIPDNGIAPAKVSGLAKVATSGSYEDLEDTPTIPANIVTYTSDQNSNITYNRNPSLKVSGGGNTDLGQSVEDFVMSNANIKAEIIAAVVAELTSTSTASGTAMQKAAIGAALPVGTIIMWEEAGNIPCGWEEVEGMRSRFPVGAGTGISQSGMSFSTYGLRQTGGEEKHTLIVTEIPKHTHDFVGNLLLTRAGQWDSSSSGRNNIVDDPNNPDGAKTKPWGGNSNEGTDAHENRPPYYAVKFIKKTSNCVDTRNSYN
ncbi:MAG: hypothetical protein LBK18_04315 [Prevotellaceae bacterium]|jgi:hypothetical protein|nr:hypothetical protein [Prevotellaceae bacterium]